MAAHFLLRPERRGGSALSSGKRVSAMTEEEAREFFRESRWTDGIPTCPICDQSDRVSEEYKKVKDPTTQEEVKIFHRWRCKRCRRPFTETNKTLFGDHKLSFKQILSLLLHFANGNSGVKSSGLKDIAGVDFKTAYVFTHKLRFAVGAWLDTIEIDDSIVDPADANDLQKAMKVPFTGEMKRIISLSKEQVKDLEGLAPAAGKKGFKEVSGPISERYLSIRDFYAVKTMASASGLPMKESSVALRYKRIVMDTHFGIQRKYQTLYAKEAYFRELTRRMGAEEMLDLLIRIGSMKIGSVMIGEHSSFRLFKGYWKKASNLKEVEKLAS